MSSRDEILHKLKALAEQVGPGITMATFRQRAGVSERAVIREWGAWSRLRRAAGLSEHPPPHRSLSDQHLLSELNRVGHECGEFPSETQFQRLSGHSWHSLARRFGRRRQIWLRYRTWLARQPPETRPDYLRGVDLDADPASIPGVTDHKSPEERQRAIDAYNEQLLYLTPALLGPPPPGWKAGVGNRESGIGIRDSGLAEKRKSHSAESVEDGKKTCPAAKEECAPGGSTGAKRTEAKSAEAGLVIVNPVTELTPEEWNEFYNHPKAVPIVDVGAGLFPWMQRMKDPHDPRPNPPPWEFGMG